MIKYRVVTPRAEREFFDTEFSEAIKFAKENKSVVQTIQFELSDPPVQDEPVTIQSLQVEIEALKIRITELGG